MKHKISIDGYAYRIRPVKITDAEFIIRVRLSNQQRNKFLHSITDDVEAQKSWIEKYFDREGDYYFVIENKITGNPEGLIGIYDVHESIAEWGRWVTVEGSMCPAESVDLIYRAAFEKLDLKELYCHTIKDNEGVVEFHDTIGEKTRKIIPDAVKLDGKQYDIVEQYGDRKQYVEYIHPLLSKRAYKIYEHNLKHAIGKMEFHHIGVAVKSIEKEMLSYQMMGYIPEGEVFEDEAQGIRGLFMVAKQQPRIELLENLEGHHTVDAFIENNTKMYHYAYLVDDTEKAQKCFMNMKCKVISPIKQSVYFKSKICFMVLPNMFMFELIEKGAL